MDAVKLLLDANVFIALEDPRVVSSSVAALAQKALLHRLSIFLDEACVEDINRDPDLQRREATLSKIAKFPILSGVAHRPLDEQVRRFGQIRNDNDRCDVLMLDTLDLGVVDFLVTEDIDLSRRAEHVKLRDRVFTVREALAWIRRVFEPKDFSLRYIVPKKAHQLSLNDPIFGSLREDYPNFNTWFAKCIRTHRDCWIVEIENQLAGLVIWKEEPHNEAKTVTAGRRILKVCALKMRAEYFGERFGEQLLKKILWFAQGNQFDLVYLTVFPKQELLIGLLRTFGFRVTRTLENGELMMERLMDLGSVQQLSDGETALEYGFRAYPRFFDSHPVGKYVVPIQSMFHAILFPEIAEAPDLPLFPKERFLISPGHGRDRTPGNTIRKVYLCRTPTRTLKAGDILLFYLSKSDSLSRSQSITTVGIVEATHLAETSGELIRLAGRRSVYSRETLETMAPSTSSPVMAIDFLLCGHLSTNVRLADLLRLGVFVGAPSQSIKRLGDAIYGRLRSAIHLDFE